jgi:hypothetical protein
MRRARGNGLNIGDKPPTKRRAEPLVSVSGTARKSPAGGAGLVGSLGPASGGWVLAAGPQPNAEPRGWLMVPDETRTF